MISLPVHHGDDFAMALTNEMSEPCVPRSGGVAQFAQSRIGNLNGG
jgi:hypothetical protein